MLAFAIVVGVMFISASARMSHALISTQHRDCGGHQCRPRVVGSLQNHVLRPKEKRRATSLGACSKYDAPRELTTRELIRECGYLRILAVKHTEYRKLPSCEDIIVFP